MNVSRSHFVFSFLGIASEIVIHILCDIITNVYYFYFYYYYYYYLLINI